MGGAMAEALLSAGYKVVGFDVAKAPRSRLKKAGGRALASCAEVACSADVLLSSLPSVDALVEVVEEITAADLSENCPRILIETSTLSIEDKERALKRMKRYSIEVLDCPISGTAQRLKERAWTIFVSGNPNSCRKIAPVLAVFTEKAPYVGPFGNGSKMKFIANHLVAIHNVAVAESITFARKLGLNAAQVWELFAFNPVVGNGVYKLRGHMMVERAYRPATMKIRTWQKDMQVIGDSARSADCPLPLFSACVPIYSSAMARGLADADTASVCSVLEEMSGGVPPE
jgi:3-hydroxyisobutyrate dehydrogenase-like beta-hydroxyacid dehydrogenase